MTNMSVLKGMLLSTLLIVSIFTAVSPQLTFAAESITASSISFEKTTIIEFENNSESEIKTFRLWLSSGFNFKSFKTEKGWTGQKTSAGVLILTSEIPLKNGESVKFGIKTDKEKPPINWKALDSKGKQIDTGKTLVSDSSSKKEPPKNQETEIIKSSDGILPDSKFRLVPEKPGVGSHVRVTGSNFAPNQEFDFYLDSKKLHSFKTDNNGYFIFTTQIPESEKSDRVEFLIKDKQGNEKSLSIRLAEQSNREELEDNIPLSIKNLPSIMHRGDVITLEGTGEPSSSITISITDPNDKIITTNATKIDSKGNWKFETIVPIDSPLGKYSAKITDGKETILRSWNIESSQTIQIIPTKLKFEPGEVVTFNGTVKPNQPLEVIIENPQRVEVFQEIIDVDSSGFVEISFETLPSDLQGTYILFAFQGEDSVITLVGLGEMPEEQLVAKFDKLNYKAGEKAIIAIEGPPSSTISLLILDPSDKPKGDVVSLTLGPDGKLKHELDLTGFASGVYTAVIKRGNSQEEATFTVGLQTGSGEISISTTKETYGPGDQILVLGETNANVLITLHLVDPEGNEVKVKETFSNKEGKISDNSFRIPADAVSGKWKIIARSGPNNDTAEFQVVKAIKEGIEVEFEKIEKIAGITLVQLNGFGATPVNSVTVTVTDPDGNIVEKNTLVSSKDGEFEITLNLDNIITGTYTVSVIDTVTQETAQTTFVIS